MANSETTRFWLVLAALTIMGAGQRDEQIPPGAQVFRALDGYACWVVGSVVHLPPTTWDARSATFRNCLKAASDNANDER